MNTYSIYTYTYSVDGEKAIFYVNNELISIFDDSTLGYNGDLSRDHVPRSIVDLVVEKSGLSDVSGISFSVVDTKDEPSFLELEEYLEKDSRDHGAF